MRNVIPASLTEVKILVFAPHSLLWKHAFPEALVAEALQQNCHQIVYATCGGIFSEYCISMFSSQVAWDAPAEEKARICARCTRNSHVLREEFRFPGADLADKWTAEDRAEADAFMARVDRGNFRDLEVEGLKVGRLALYQVMLRRKKITYDFSDAEWGEYLAHLKSTVIAAIALRRLFATEKPDRIIVYNGLYSVNSVCRELAVRNGAVPYFLHAGGGLTNRLQTLMMGRGHTFDFYDGLLANWERFRDVPVPHALMRPATDHMIQLLIAKSPYAYSAMRSQGTFDIRSRFGIAAGQKILVATMGSYDEEVAAEEVGARVHRRPPLFASQVDWLRCVIGWMAARPDLFLVVRVHPRELPNRRESIVSEHTAALRSLLVDLPANVSVNWPDQGISLYDLVDETDVFLNSWSSAGKEMAIFGRPVVTYGDSLIFYPTELNYVAPTPEAYLIQIERAIADGWNAERIRMSYRWLAIEYSRSLIDISESYDENDSSKRRAFATRVVNKLGRMLVDPDLTHKRDCRRRARSLAAAGAINRMVEAGAATILDVLDPEAGGRTDAAGEMLALRSEIGRLMPFLYKGRARPKPGSLHAYLADFVAGVPNA